MISLLSGAYNAWYTLPAVEQGLNLACARSPPSPLPSPAFDDTSLRFRWVGTTCAQVKVLGSAESAVALVSRPRRSLSLRQAHSDLVFHTAFLTQDYIFDYARHFACVHTRAHACARFDIISFLVFFIFFVFYFSIFYFFFPKLYSGELLYVAIELEIWNTP